MFLIVGLGNPGAKYRANRHNAGFLAVDVIADQHGFGPERSKFNGQLREGQIGAERCLILKPQTFYNDSGNSVAAAARFHKIDVDRILVAHDEIDLAPGKIRVKKGGGLAGNNGLRSTAAHLGPDFWRLRIGIGHPGHKDAVTNWVLGDFSKAERSGYLDEMLDRIARALPDLLPPDEAKVGRFMSLVAPPQPKKEKPAEPASPPPMSPERAAQVSKGKEEKSSPFEALKGLVKKGD